MKLIYLNSDNNAVMEAQVLSLLEYYRNTNRFNDIILLQGFKSISEKDALRRKLDEFKSKIVWFNTWPVYTVFQNFAFYSLSTVLDNFILDDETIIHVRGELYGAIIHKYLCRKKSATKLLIDIRGVILEEIDKYYSRNFFLKRNRILLFKKVYRKIIKDIPITVVSEAFKEYLIVQHGFSKQNICVHPNIADEQFVFNQKLRQKIRKELGIYENEIVAICSSNGATPWQKDKEIIASLISLNVKVINLSSKQQEIPGVINMFVSFKSMPAYLAAADVAILWRDKNVVNEVASPSKFSEFATMGLWVIHNDTVRIAADYIRLYKAGIIVKSINQITNKQISSFSNYDRKYYSTIGRNIFGVENISKSYISHYEKILQKS
jgi:hypothetical protein